jgi:hypothetical protein
MAIYSKLSNVRKLTNSSLGSIIDVSNLNFTDLSSAVLEYLNNISYNEKTNAIQGLTTLNAKYVNVANELNVQLNGVTTFNIDSQGRAEGNSFLVEVAEAKRYRHTDFNNWPTIGIAGEIIYTGVQNQRPEFGEDFIGYLDGRGWVSLTQGGPSYGLTIIQQVGSPGIPDTPASGTGIVWIGDPLLATTSTPTTQDLYFTDENGDIFSLTSGSGGGGGSNTAYVETTGFTANVTKTITHALVADGIVVDLIDEDTGDRIDGHLDNYTLNTVDITLTQDVANVKIVIVSAGGSVSSNKAVVTFTPGAVGSANTITHSLGTSDIIVQLWDVTTGEVFSVSDGYADQYGVVISNATSSTVDITFSISNPAGDVKAVMI